MDFDRERLVLILFVYGLAFFSMGLAILLQANRKSQLPLARNLWALAAFGLLHAGVEWLDMVSVSRLYGDPLFGPLSTPVVRAALLVASSLALLWFGAALAAEAGGRWRLCLALPPLALVLWIVVVTAESLHGLAPAASPTAWISLWTRYLLYFPASVLSGIALARQAPSLRALGMVHIAADCRWAAALFAVNAVVAGLVVPPASFFPASVINHETFLAAIGLPPHLFRGAAALMIAFLIVRVLRLFDLQQWIERERFASQALLAQEEERKRIARELHDEPAQLVSSLLVRLTLLDQVTSLEEARKARVELTALASRASESIRRLAVELRPPELDDLGLAEALRWYVEDFGPRWGLSAQVGVEGRVPRVSPVAEMALYRIAQESLSNVAKHASATSVTVKLKHEGGSLKLSVEDDGRGFDIASVMASRDRGMGLFGMQERATLLGGKLRLDSELGRGTRLYVDAPLTLESQ